MKKILGFLVIFGFVAQLVGGQALATDFRNRDETGDIVADGGLLVRYDFTSGDMNVASRTIALGVSPLSGTPARHTMPMGGSVLAISCFGARPAAGSIQFEVTLDGADTGLTCDWSHARTSAEEYGYQAKDLDAFSAGAKLGVKMTSNSSWSFSACRDMTISVLVELGHVTKY